MPPLVRLAAVAAFACASPAFAQIATPETNLDTLPRFGQAQDWRVTVGAAGIVQPAWRGAAQSRIDGTPDIDVRWRNRAFASLRNGAGLNAIDSGGWRAGPYLAFDPGRKERRSARLKGLGDVDAALAAGAFVERTWRFARASANVRRGLGGRAATVADIGGDAKFRLSERVALSAGPRLRFADAAYMRAFYGVDAGQSTRSGLPAFAAGGGLESAGLAGAIVVRPQPDVTVTLFASQTRLFGDAAASPLVRLRGAQDQTVAGIAIGYRLGRRARCPCAHGARARGRSARGPRPASYLLFEMKNCA
jgi:outer membrane scaffolding protein for murein synthesis (MipA/OmpV family)